MILDHLRHVHGPGPGQDCIPCIALTHNEMAILPDFLDHYRGLGAVGFAIVDDRSDDGSREFLISQPDVTVYEPKADSSYAAHKRQWRQSLLDLHAPGKWCLVPDIDEHLVYRDCETRSLADLIAALEAEGAETLHCTMLDMYSDRPLSEHVYDGKGLAATFSLTDGPESYFMLPAPRRYRRRYPSPYMLVQGGMRRRLFFQGDRPSRLQAALLDRFASVYGSFNPGAFRRFAASTTRKICRSLLGEDPFIVTKLTLLKWRSGLGFSGGSHSVTAPLKVSEQSAALLHYKFVRGVGGLQYIAERGQHAGGGRYYRKILEEEAVINASPVYGGTREYRGSGSLDWILR